MDARDTIRRRIVDRAVDLFNKDNPNGGGMFTTAHYGQALKAEFRMSGPCPDGATCTEHLAGMDGVERAGGNMWRRLARQGGPAQSDISETAEGRPDDPHGVRLESYAVQRWHDRQLLEIEDKVMAAVMGILVGAAPGPRPDIRLGGNMWWSVETMADAVKNNDLVWDGLLENMVGLVLYTMAVGGRVVSQPNMLVDGARVTVFALAPKGADAENGPPSGRPPSEGRR